MSLSLYAALIMLIEPFLWYQSDDSTFIEGVILMVPFLLAMSPLVRFGAWIAATGSALFFASSLAMLMHNGSCRHGGSGFFSSWVS